jgi:hypothetical protein
MLFDLNGSQVIVQLLVGRGALIQTNNTPLLLLLLLFYLAIYCCCRCCSTLQFARKNENTGGAREFSS